MNPLDSDKVTVQLEAESPLSRPVQGLMDHEQQDSNILASDKRLLELGYKPEFRREMSLFGVLGMSFCAIGILTGMSSAFQTGLFSGGPLGLFWGWNVCCFGPIDIPFRLRSGRFVRCSCSSLL
jgi:hypothetical protein